MTRSGADTDPVTPTRRRGRRYRPLTRRGLGAYALAMGMAAVLLLGLTVRTAQGHAAEQRADAGPTVRATVVSTKLTKTSGKNGPHHHSAYRVAFQTTAGAPVVTTIRVEGSDPCSCAQTLVAYDPTRPTNARIVGTAHRDGLGAVVGLALLGALLLGLAGLFGWLWRRAALAPTPAGVAGLRAARVRRPLGARRWGLVLLPVPLLVVVLLSGKHFGQVQPAKDFFVRNVALGASGHGTGGCLGLPASAPTPPAGDLRELLPAATDAIRQHGHTGPQATGPRYIRDGTDPQLGPILTRTWASLGGGVRASGMPAADAYAANGPFPSPTYTSVDIRTLHDPVAAARWDDAYEAAGCYFARGSGPARALDPPVSAPGSVPVPREARFYAAPCRCHSPGLTEVFASATVGRYSLEVTVVGPDQDVPATTETAGALLATASAPAPTVPQVVAYPVGTPTGPP